MATTDTPVPGPDHAALIPLAAHAGAPPIIIKRPLTAIGSRKDAVRIHLDSSTVSKVHCVIVLNDWGCYVHDMGSRTHTWVNGQQVSDADLNDGDTLQVGRFQFKYAAPTNVRKKTARSLTDVLDLATLSDPLHLQKRVIQIGRRVGSDLHLDEDKVSNIHAILFECNGIRFVRDMGSRTGTWLDGKPVHQEPLYDNAQLKIGGAILSYRLETEEIEEPELSTTSTLTLDEAEPMPSIGLDAPLELEEADFAKGDLALDLTDPAPSASDDALADLRREWQTPGRAIELPVPAEGEIEPVKSGTPELEETAPEIELPVSKEAVPEEVAEPAPLIENIASDALVMEPEAVKPVESVESTETVSQDEPLALEPVEVPEINLSPIELDDAPVEPVTAEVSPEPAAEIVVSAAEIEEEPKLDLSDQAALPLAIEPEAEHDEAEAELVLDLSQIDESEIAVPPLDLESDGITDDITLDEISPEIAATDTPTDSVSHVADKLAEDETAADDLSATESTPAAETVPSPEAALADLLLPAEPGEVLGEAAIDELLADEPIAPLPEAEIEALPEPVASVSEHAEPEAESPAPESIEAEAPAIEEPESLVRPAEPLPIATLLPEPEPERDAVDLSVDLDQPYETPDDATALAVDFGLDELDTSDDDEADHPSIEAARQAAIDFASPGRALGSGQEDLKAFADTNELSDHDSLESESLDLQSDELDPLDLSNLENIIESEASDENVPERPLINMADTIHGQESVLDLDEVFEAESVDIVGESPADSQAPAVASVEMPSDTPQLADDDIPAPKGGTLNDLMPSGPALLGGAFTGDLHGPVVGGSPALQFTNEKPPAQAPQKRRGPLRVGFGNGQRPQASPFASNAPTIGDVLIGRRGGASVDVFANPSPSAEELALANSIPESGPADHGSMPAAADDELADVKLSAEQLEILKTAEAFRSRGPVPEPAPTIPPIASAAELAAQRANAHKRHVGWIGGGFLMMALLIGGAVAAVYNYMPVYSTVDALVAFSSLDRLGTDDARQFRATQDDNLQSEAVRQGAIQSLPQQVTFGFLADTHQMASAINADPKIRWPSDQPTVMRLRYRSLDKANDIARVRALAQAVIDAHATDINSAATLRKLASAEQVQISTLQEKLDDVNAQLQILQQAGDQRPDPAKIAQLVTDRQTAEAALRDVRATRQELEATEARLAKEPTTEPTVDSSAVATAGSSDDELTKLNTQLADLQKQGELLTANANDKTSQARKQLDDTIADVQQSMQTAQKLRDNPDLVAYVDSASHLFTLTRQLTESLIQRQENMRTRLMELKSTLSDRVAARTADLLAKDDELNKLNDELAIGTRQYNAAIAQGYNDDAKKLELQNQLYKSLIGARTDLLGKDPANSANSDAIDRIQDMIQQQEKSIEEDRSQINDTLAKEQDNFMQHAPAVDKLPAEQKALAEALEQKLGAVTQARQAYDSASESSQVEQAKTEAALKDKTAALQLEIAAHKHDLALAATQEQAREAATAKEKELASTRTALADARSKEQVAQAKLDGIIAAQEQAEKLRREFTDSDTDREIKLAAKQNIEQQLQALQASLGTQESDLARLIVPEPKFDLQTFDDQDRRLMFAGIAAAGIFILMMIPIGWNLFQLWRDAHSAHAAPITLAQAPVIESHAAAFDPIVAEETHDESSHDDHDAPLLATAHG